MSTHDSDRPEDSAPPTGDGQRFSRDVLSHMIADMNHTATLSRLQVPTKKPGREMRWQGLPADKLSAIFSGLRSLKTDIIKDLQERDVGLTEAQWWMFEAGHGYDSLDAQGWEKLCSVLTAHYWRELMAVIPRTV